MKHLTRVFSGAALATALSVLMLGCETPAPANALPELGIAIENTPVTVSRSADAAVFVDDSVADAILRDLQRYFATQNDGEWDVTLDYYPMHRSPMDSAVRAQTVEGMQSWWDKGLRNQTEVADLLYASEIYPDGDQSVVLLNLDLVHRVVFVDFQDGNPEGMKGMVESSYGKGNAVFISHPGPPKVEYWEVRGDNRIWAVKADSGDHWCFLPANFNERGGAQFMSVDAMTALLRHRSENDPHRLN